MSYGTFAIEKGETAKKIFFELIVILDIFQPKNHIWHININFIFLAVSPFSIAKGPYIKYKVSEISEVSVTFQKFLVTFWKSCRFKSREVHLWRDISYRQT